MGTVTSSSDLLEILLHLAVAMAAGGLIGLERSYNGHSAGFRTHTLVCMASSLLMLIVLYQEDWIAAPLTENLRVDPTRMAQGIMTGIGFLGAGVIMKEGLSVRGLTTAASIWITAAIGILAGVGFYSALVIVTVMTLGTLSVFRWIESRVPTLIYAHCSLRIDRETSMSERDLRVLLARHGFDILKLSYAFTREDAKCFNYHMMIRTRRKQYFENLSQNLLGNESVLAFHISLTGD
jgi:putative Mg2+ transporter-C (MgtC) family protein